MTITEWKRSRSLFQALGCWIRQIKRLALYLRDKFQCLICRKRLSGHDPRAITLDHHKPRSKGGSNHERNLYTACLTCNARRKDAPGLRHGRIERARKTPLAPFIALARKLMQGRTWPQALRAAGRLCREGM